MKFATFVTDVKSEMTIQIPLEVREKLRLEAGTRVEISLKKIKSGKFDLLMSENPLYKLIDLARVDDTTKEQ